MQIEVLGALKGLGEVLSSDETSLLEKSNSVSLQQFIKVSTDPGYYLNQFQSDHLVISLFLNNFLRFKRKIAGIS